MDKLKIYVWPDNSWVSEEDIDDIDWYISSGGISDDYAEYMVPIELEADDIDELIELQALEGMPPDLPEIKKMGKIKISDNSTLIIHSINITYDEIVIKEGKVSINISNATIEVI